MGITNPAEQYFKDGGWHWTGSTWIKGGLAFEYAGDIMGRLANASSGAGYQNLQGGAVPAGEIWVITAMEAHSAVLGTSATYVGVRRGAVDYWAGAGGALPVDAGFSWAGQICLVEGDKPQCGWICAAGGRYLLFHWFGYIMRLT